MSGAKIAVVTSDNRSPLLTSRNAIVSYPALAFALNALYACKHRYDMLYYQMMEDGCMHAKQGTICTGQR